MDASHSDFSSSFWPKDHTALKDGCGKGKVGKGL
jgi:hypothetical protein